MVSQSTPDKLEEELKNVHATVIQTSLPKEDEARLREYLGAEGIEV